MTVDQLVPFLRKKGYRDTQQRRMVLEALERLHAPSSPYDIQKWIAGRKGVISIVTVYRIIDIFLNLGIVHRHPCSGKFSLCEHPGASGAHAYLHCHDCGGSEEFCSTELSATARTQARKHGFSSLTPLLEIIGVCKRCS